MNWQTVEQANGQNAQMNGTITEFCGEGINEKSGKPWKKVKVTDGNKIHNVTLRGDTLPGPDALDKPSSFTLATYQGTYQNKQYTGYSGFWNGLAQGQPAPQGFSQSAQKLGNKKQEPDWDKIAEGKVRCNVVCSGIQSGQLECKTPAAVDYWTDFVMRHEEIQPESPDGPDYLPEDTTDYSQEPDWMK